MPTLPAPLAPNATPVAVPAGSPSAIPTDPTSGFGALVAQLLGLAPPTPPPTPPTDPLAVSTVVPAAAPVAAVAQAADPTAEPLEDKPVDDSEALLVDELEPMLPTLGAALAAQLAVAALATRVNTPAAVVAPAEASTEVLAERPVPAQALPTLTAPIPAAQGPAEVGVSPSREAAASQPTGPDQSAPGLVAPTTADTSAEAPASAPAQIAPATPTAPAAQAVPAPSAGALTPPPTAPAEVHRQVFPEITRLISTGTGTHRITLELSPEALGEVKVTLIVRDGSMHVRLAAGDEAQRALLEGAPELRRLLEATGASDTKIVVRDLPSGSASGGAAPSTSQGQVDGGSPRQPAGQAGTDGHGAPDQHAWTRGGGSTARDGTSGGASAPRHVDQVTHTRTTGVDVTV